MSPVERATAVVTELFETWHAPMVRFALRSVGNYQTAEEIVQEAFTDLYKHLRSGKTVDHPKAWVMRVIRRRVWREFANAKEEVTPIESVLDLPTRMQESSELAQLLHRLTPRESEAVLLRAAGMDYSGIAQELGIATGTVGALLCKALRRMQEAAQRKPARSGNE